MALLYLNASIAADINFYKSESYILIKGEIVEGDYERFVNAVLEGGVGTGNIYLYSNGGDVEEALKIGQLIRDLGFSTKAPYAPPSISNNQFKLKASCASYINVSDDECTCMSACVLIYMAGVQRFGDFLGVHRAFLNHEDLRGMSFEQSKAFGDAASNMVNEYLLRMSAPISLIDKMNATSSGSVEILSPEYVDKYLSGISPDYEEWLIAKCGDYQRNHDLFFEASDRDTREKYFAQLGEISNCNKKILSEETERIFFSVISDAIGLVNPKNIPHRSLLAYIHNVENFELTDLVGIKNDEAVDLMSLLGVGPARPIDHELINVSIMFYPSIEILFDSEGKVHKVDLYFNDYFENMHDYEGYFLGGLTKESGVEDFLNKYGEPMESGCFPSDNCFVLFEHQKADIEVLFDKNKELINLGLSPPGYWRAGSFQPSCP